MSNKTITEANDLLGALKHMRSKGINPEGQDYDARIIETETEISNMRAKIEPLYKLKSFSTSTVDYKVLAYFVGIECDIDVIREDGAHHIISVSTR